MILLFCLNITIEREKSLEQNREDVYKMTKPFLKESIKNIFIIVDLGINSNYNFATFYFLIQSKQ